jgi:large subunit ribosomal protein L14e
MVFEKFVSIGGIVFSEAHQKPMTVVNVISLNRLQCDDGNCGRYEVNTKNIRLTDLKLKITWGARPGTVKKAWAAANMTEAYAQTDMAKAAATKSRRANLSDFERYKLMRLKQARNRIVNQEVGKLRKQK